MSILKTLFEEEYQNIKEQLKNDLLEQLIDYAAIKLLSEIEFNNPAEFKIVLESLINYIETEILEDDIYSEPIINNLYFNEDENLVTDTYIDIFSKINGIIESVKFLKDSGILRKLVNENLGISTALNLTEFDFGSIFSFFHHNNSVQPHHDMNQHPMNQHQQHNTNSMNQQHITGADEVKQEVEKCRQLGHQYESQIKQAKQKLLQAIQSKNQQEAQQAIQELQQLNQRMEQEYNSNNCNKHDYYVKKYWPFIDTSTLASINGNIQSGNWFVAKVLARNL